MRDLVERRVPTLLARCVELVGEDPFARVAESTRFAQPAIYCASIAGWVGSEPPAMPIAFAGHSLGEIAALVAGGAIDQFTGLELAALRGDLMARASADGADRGMLALVGASEAQCEALAEAHSVVLANENAPGQVVLAGALDALDRLARDAKQQGLRAMKLDVADAFHSPAMAGAVEPFRAALREVAIVPPKTPVISCASARAFENICDELADAIVKPVRWRATMQALVAAGAGAFVDFGPGRVLARLATRNVPGAKVVEPRRDGGGPEQGAVPRAA